MPVKHTRTLTSNKNDEMDTFLSKTQEHEHVHAEVKQKRIPDKNCTKTLMQRDLKRFSDLFLTTPHHVITFIVARIMRSEQGVWTAVMRTKSTDWPSLSIAVTVAIWLQCCHLAVISLHAGIIAGHRVAQSVFSNHARIFILLRRTCIQHFSCTGCILPTI